VRKLKKIQKSIIILFVATTGLFSFGQVGKSTPDTVDTETSNSTENLHRQLPFGESQRAFTNHIENIDTKYEYADSNRKHLVIENSLPRGGLKYTDPHDKYMFMLYFRLG
jgi:hypothetical protein